MDNRSGNKPELLAPAGGWPQLKAAVRFGADAVYLACDKFGMRARATNFALDEIPQVVSFAHAEGVKVHVTLNTLMDARDIAQLPPYLEALDAAGVDAFIIGDMGAFSLARTYAPHVDIHVSTQASVMNAEAARVWHSLGARRIVCAREMSVEDIAQMRANIPDDLEIEAFVHGAMCVAYSGRCLLSAAMTGRSGNKGACAQSCRWSYALVEEQRPGQYYEIQEDTRGTFILNAQDLNMVSHLDDLAKAGVDSFKIEGRNKQAFYVATVVGAYRNVLDGGDASVAERELLTISHRPYSTGFYYGRADQTPERDGYVKECVHVATVEDCVPAEPEGVAPQRSAEEPGGMRTSQAEAAATNSSNEQEGEWRVAQAEDAATHNPDEQTGEWRAAQAEVTATRSPDEQTGEWRVTVLCHNRFEPGDTLGVVSPYLPSREMQVSHPLRWLAPADGGKPFVERAPLTLAEARAQSVETLVEVANRSKERYVFTSNIPVKPGDYLRKNVTS